VKIRSSTYRFPFLFFQHSLISRNKLFIDWFITSRYKWLLRLSRKCVA